MTIFVILEQGKFLSEKHGSYTGVKLDTFWE